MRNRKIGLIIKHFGVERQIKKLIEECEEFLQEPYLKNGSPNWDEMEDIYNVITGIHDAVPKFQRDAEKKQDRTLHRIATIPDYF